MDSKKPPKRQYSENDQALALATLTANGNNISKTARQLNIPAATLRKWRDGHVHPEVTQKCEVKKKELADKLEEVAHALTDNLLIRAESDFSIFVPMKDIATSLGIVIDKRQLLQGKPTSINKDITPQEKREKVREWMKEQGIIESHADN